MIFEFSSLSRYWSLNMCEEPRTASLPPPRGPGVVKASIGRLSGNDTLPDDSTATAGLMQFSVAPNG